MLSLGVTENADIKTKTTTNKKRIVINLIARIVVQRHMAYIVWTAGKSLPNFLARQPYETWKLMILDDWA